jgi:hypothetical protein
MTDASIQRLLPGFPDVAVFRSWVESREMSGTKFVTEEQAGQILQAVKDDEWVSIWELNSAQVLLLGLKYERAEVSDRFRKGEISAEVMAKFDTAVARAEALYAKMEEAAEQYIAEQNDLQPPDQP